MMEEYGWDHHVGDAMEGPVENVGRDRVLLRRNETLKIIMVFQMYHWS